MKKMLFGAAMLCVALTGCENEDFTAATQSQVLRFDAPAMVKTTRANVMGEISGVKYPEAENFTVFCKSYTGKFNGWTASDDAEDYFAVEGEVASSGFTVGTGNYWATAVTHYWPEIEYSLAFAAYSPAELGAAAATATISHTAQGLQIENFKTEADADEQYDLMYSDRKYDLNKTNANSAVPLVFNHALSSIVFSSQKASTDVDYEITKIEVKGKFSQEGDFNQGITEVAASGSSVYSETAVPTWSNLVSATTDVTYAPNFSTFSVPAGSPAPFTSGNSAMLLIPQSVPEDATVTVYYTKITNPGTAAEKEMETVAEIKLRDFEYVESGASHKITNWEMGKRYVYRIAFGQNTRIYFEPSVVDWVQMPTLVYTIQ